MTEREGTHIPRWLELQGEIDFTIWQLEEFQRLVGKRSRLDEMIDEATGYEQTLRDEATSLMEHLTALMGEWNALTGEATQ